MAKRCGQPVDLWEETLLYLKGLPSGADLNQWLIKDFLEGCRNNEFSKEEFDAVISRLRQDYGLQLRPGSLRESIKSAPVADLCRQTGEKAVRQKSGFMYASKLDELELRR